MLQEILALPEDEYDNFCVLLEAQLILAGRKIKDLEDISVLRRAYELRSQTQPTSLAEAFPDLPGAENFFVPAGYVMTRAGIVYGGSLVSSCPFYVAGRILNQETGQGSYVLKYLIDSAWHDVVVPAVHGPGGIVKAVQAAGIYVKTKSARQFAEKYLALNWA